MTNFTQKQQSYIENRAAGLKKRAAAEAAGYSPATAEAQANNMERREDIKNAIARAKRALKSTGVDIKEDDGNPKHEMPKKRYECSKEFLIDAMNHPLLPLAVRGEWAKALLPYQHARIAEKTKKDTAKDAATAISSGGKASTGSAKRHKFSKKAPPREPRARLN